MLLKKTGLNISDNIMNASHFSTKIILLLLLLSGTFCANILYAQSTTGLKDMQAEPMESPEAIPVFRDYPENGVLIIESFLANIRFSSSVDFEADLSEPSKGIYRFILKPYQQTITAVLSGYRMLRFSIPEVQPREAVYYSVFSTESASENDLNVTVRFLIKPKSAVLYVNNVQQDHTNSISLPRGTASVRIQQPGMKTIQDEITISPENNFFDYSLEDIEQEIVTINTTPSDATIAVNDVEQGRNQFFLFPGQYNVRISKSNYTTISTTIEVTEGGNNTFSYSLNSIVARLTLNISPADAQIRVDNRIYRQDEDIILSPGQHLLTVSKDGHEEYRERLTLEENEQISRNIALTAITGGLLFGVTPSSAEVSLINSSGTVVENWTGLNKIDELPVGTYKVQATAEAFQPLDHVVIIKADESSMYDLTMVKESEKPESEPEPKPAESDEMFIIVENQPKVIGAPTVQHAMAKHLVYPELARRSNIEGRVMIQFIVDTNGNVRDANVIRGIGGGCDEAALDALKKVRFNPGTQRGKPVNVKLIVPVVFRLQ